MEIASLIVEQTFDKELLEQIGSLRCVRLSMAENMLKGLDETAQALERRGLAADVDKNELRKELQERIATLRERLLRPDIIFADEIELYADLIDEEAGR